ncbi:MAG TPA: translocation/assembly module TamB domain-containing protein [Azospirillum sp.]|nr:translocation/assembly module TamB domain-containing protein [Azospirillum sp.]
MKVLRYALFGLAGLLLLIVAAVAAGAVWLQSESGRRWLVATIEGAASGPDSSLSLGTLSGRVPFDLTLSDVRMADRDGVWLTLRDAHLALNPWALLQRRVEVTELTAAQVAVERAPVPSTEPQPASSTQPGLPRLPVSVAVDRLAVGELRLGEALLGEAAVLSIDGNARLAAGGDGLDARLAVARIDDRPGRAALTLGFAPDDQRLDLDLKASEPAGGVIARLLNIPGLPPVEATLDGEGTLADWKGRLTAAGGDVVTLTADAAVKADPGGHVVTLDARGDVARLLPAPAADLVGPAPTLAAEVLVAPDRTLTLRPVTAATAAGTVRLTGTVNPESPRLNVRAEVEAGPDSALHALAPVRWRDARVTLTADGTTAELPFSIAARITDVAADDPKLASVTGPEVTLDAKGLVQTDGGRLRLDGLTLATAAGTVTASGTAAGWGQTADAALRVALDDLSRLSALAGRPLAGTAVLEGPVTVREGAVSADLGGRVANLATGTPADALLGEEARLTLKAATAPDGRVTVSDLRVEGANTTLTGTAALAGGRLEADATLALPRLEPLGAALEKPMQGDATLDLSARGPLDALEARAHLTGRGLELDGRRLGDTELTATAAGLPATPRGTVQARAQLAGTGLALDGGYALAGDTLTLSDLALVSGPNRVGGTVAVALDAMTATGRLEGTLPALRALSELAGMGLDGAAGFALTLDGKGGKQAATLTADARGLRVEGADGPLLAAQSLTVSGDVSDALGAAAGKARVEVQDGTLAGTPVTGLTATADGSLARARFQVQGSGGGGREPGTLDLAGTFAQERGVNRIRLERLDARAAGQALRLGQPASIDVAENRYEVNGLQLLSGNARLTADAALTGDRMKGAVRVEQLPLALARLFDPTLQLDGVLNATADLSGTPKAPSADVSVRVAGLRATATQQAGVPGLDVTVDAQWRGERLNATGAVVSRGGDGRLNLSAALPLVLDPQTLVPAVPERGKLDASATGTLQLSLANDLLAASGDRVAGTLALDVRAGGTVGAPQLGGTVTVANGRFENRASGAVVTDIAARVVGSGDVFTVQSFTGRTLGGGTLSAEGVIRPAPREPRQLDLRVRARDARLAQIDMVTASLGADLTLTGTFAKSALAGTVTITEAEVQLPDRLPPNVVDLKVVEVGRGAPASQDYAMMAGSSRAAPPKRKPGARATPAALPAEPPPPAAEPAGPEIGLDVTIAADNRIFVRGRGLNAEFGGRLKVGGTADRPSVTGRFSMLKGTLDLLAKTFTFKRGFIDFDGNWPVDPRLDLLAEASANQVTAQVQISGTAKQPKLELTSPQGLPQDEVLARVLFGKSVGSLGAVEAVQLAQSAATLAGFGGGSGLLDQVRKRLGVDRLEFTGGENGKGGAVQAGRYVSDRVYVGVEQGVGAGNGQSRAKVEVDITKNLKAEAGVGTGASNDTRLGLKFEWDY